MMRLPSSIVFTFIPFTNRSLTFFFPFILAFQSEYLLPTGQMHRMHRQDLRNELIFYREPAWRMDNGIPQAIRNNQTLLA